MELRQSVGNAVASGRSICTVSMSDRTTPGSLVVVIAVATHPRGFYPLYGPSGFSLARVRRADELTLAVWYREDCPSLSSISVLSSGRRSLQVRVVEYTGVAQGNALDRVAVDSTADRTGAETSSPRSGSTGTTNQDDEVVIAAIANRYASTSQSGFTGGLTQVSNSVTPSETDDHRSRLTVHQSFATQTESFGIGARLATARDWIAITLTFRGGTTGPARMSSRNAPPLVAVSGRGGLTVFGPLRSRTANPLVTVSGRGWIGPFNQQFRLGGRTGLLIGAGTPYRIESVEGLGGWDVRSSDGEFPRGDGAQRGIDLQSARQMLFRVNFDGPPIELEAAMQRLLAALVPQRDTDWDMFFRLPGLPLQVLRCRPMSLTRELSAQQLLLANQAFALRAADPRIYSARERQVQIPVTPAGSDTTVTAVSVVNAGNGRAYPIIRIVGAPDVEVTRIELRNVTADAAFEVATTIPPGGQLVGDMPAQVTAAPRPTVSLDGQQKYASWQPPREPFFLEPDPHAPGGVNAVYLRTTPAGVPVTAVLEYRDTWSG